MAADTLEESAFAPPAAESPPFSAADMGAVYEAHFQFVWRCLRGLGVRDDVLDDALQDVFMVVQRKLDRFDGQANVRTWLYGIALRVARRYRARVAKDAQKFVAEDSLPPPAGNLEHEIEAGEQLKLARRALAALDDEKREAFVLACVEQMSAPEIARITGLPLNTVYSRIRAAKLAFAAQVARLSPPSPRSIR